MRSAFNVLRPYARPLVAPVFLQPAFHFSSRASKSVLLPAQIPARTLEQQRSFKRFLEPQIESMAALFQKHPLLAEYLNPSNISTKYMSARQIFSALAPIMSFWVMDFSDFCKWWLPYKDAKNMFEQVINDHTLEDKTHSQLFVRNLDLLGIPAELGWRCGDYMRFVMSPDGKKMKKSLLNLLKITLENPHPFVRFAEMEVIERAGKEFFSLTRALASQHEELTGQLPDYFGDPHLIRENGHVANEDLFFTEGNSDLEAQRQVLSVRYGQDSENPVFRLHISDVIHQTGTVLLDAFTQWHDTAQAVKQNRDYYRQTFSQQGSTEPDTSKLAAPLKDQTSLLTIVPTILKNDIFKQGLSAIAAHPLYSALSTEKKYHAARIFTPFALVDFLGSAYIGRFHAFSAEGGAQTASEKLLQDMTHSLGSFGDALNQDWDALDLSQYTASFGTSQILAFKFFGQRSSMHRQYFHAWFRGLLENAKDAAVLCVLVDATIRIYQIFLEKFAPCLSQNFSGSLQLLDGQWFKRFQQRFQSAVAALELSKEQKEVITLQTTAMLERFQQELDHALLAVRHGDQMDFDQTTSRTAHGFR